MQGFCGHTRGKVPRKFNEPCGAMREQEAPASLEFYEGYILGFHRIVPLMQQQALAFGIELKDLQLEGIEPDRDLGSVLKKPSP